LTLKQILTDFGRTAHLVSSSRLYSRAADSATEATREEILLDLDVAFFTALKDEAVLAVARQTVASRKLVLDQVAELATNKLKSELDLDFARVAYEEGLLLLAKAQKDREEAFVMLSTLLADREQRNYQLIEVPQPAITPVDPASLVETALSNRPDLAKLRLESQGAAQYTKAQRALMYPTISAFGSGGVIPIRDTAHFEDRYAAAGVDFSLPLFDGGLDLAKHSEAKLRYQASEEKLRDAENNAIHDVRTAGLNLNYALEQLDLTAKYYENASHALELADARYKLGSSSIVELSQAQLNATQAEIAHTSAKYDCAIQQAILNFQIGAER
jgi:outer membrane protein